MRRNMNSFLLLMTMLIHPGCRQQGGDLTIVKQGSSAYVIVTPAPATKAESKAAVVLQDYIRKISGATLPVVAESQYKDQPAVFIGNTAHANGPEKIKGEGFFVGSKGANLYIHGGSGQGVVYGVYYVLQTYMGCRKDAHEPATVPTAKNIRIAGNLADLQEPAFLYRESYYPPSADPEYLSWHGLQRFEDLWGLWGHSFFKMIPPATYFSAHPEYYSLVNGKRQALQLCLSNENVYALTVAYFKKAIADNPDAMYWSVAPQDGNGACTCDLCSKTDAAEGGPQGSLIRFVNRVAAQFPAQRFTTLAYGYTAKPPLQTKPATNVYIMLSTIAAFRQTPLSEAPSAATFRKNLEGWEAATGNLFIWDYTTQFTNYLAPFPDYSNLQPNIKYFAAHHVKGVFSQGSGETYGDMAAYNSYVQASLLWNPNIDISKVNSAFLKGYYGAAGPFIGQYLEALSNAVKSTKATLDIYGNPIFNTRDYLSPVLTDQYSTLLDKAEAAAGNDNTILQRVYNTRLSLEYAVLQQSRFYGNEKYGYLQPDGSVNPKWPLRVKKFVDQCKKSGVQELSEGGISPDAYAQEWEQLFSRKWVNSLALHAAVTLVNPYTPEYTPKKEATLTDGLFGGNDFSYNWLFTYGKDMIAIIDMGSNKTVHNIQMNFLQDARHYIFTPVQVVVETSADGTHFKPAGEKATPLAGEDYGIHIVPYAFSLPGIQARYIRVTAKCAATLPDWRAVEGKKPALCCDEVTVE
ncbi:uncharacterized protein DUF4838 [Chitinophaga niastensis]|uniref:Uncharacterized protein DUF4838 n=1 Tax=Chitinophaga niastensis TaxID=536980 RepID=A0A2P8HJ19_CHINA|nr:DUF4838 domain-containing protein [Chitinophaga niastensis]PSL46213.1 uncharacterized protein DUF4838 [Chitinophaga niastensis]